MKDIKSIFSELIGFFNNLIIEERFIEFENKNDNRTMVSVNNIYSLEVIKSIIVCLFNKGKINLLNELNIEFEKGDLKIDKIDKTIFFEMGKLDEVLKSIKLKNEVKENIKIKELKTLYDEQSLGFLIKELLEAPDLLLLTKTISDCFSEEIDKITEIKSSLILNAATYYYEKKFGLKEDFIKSYAKELYNRLYPKFINCSEKDFISFCEGKLFDGKLDFNTQAELLTFIYWIKEKDFLSFDTISWKYIVTQCTVKGFSLNPNNLRRLNKGNNSPNIMDVLSAFLRHIKKP
jgi:hypothetical protein